MHIKTRQNKKAKKKVLIVYGEYIDSQKLTYKVYGG
jgi:hypothetical protein